MRPVPRKNPPPFLARGFPRRRRGLGRAAQPLGRSGRASPRPNLASSPGLGPHLAMGVLVGVPGVSAGSSGGASFQGFLALPPARRAPPACARGCAQVGEAPGGSARGLWRAHGVRPRSAPRAPCAPGVLSRPSWGLCRPKRAQNPTVSAGDPAEWIRLGKPLETASCWRWRLVPSWITSAPLGFPAPGWIRVGPTDPGWSR